MQSNLEFSLDLQLAAGRTWVSDANLSLPKLHKSNRDLPRYVLKWGMGHENDLGVLI